MRILTGVQPSGHLHWGNYFGAMKPIIDTQDQGETFVFVAQYHALTTVHDAAALRQATWDVALDFLACGLDPAKACLFRQADVPEVHELAWLLSTVTPMGLLERCHSYKDKLARGLPASHGLFAYPVLMAADILLYQSDVVPVGRDQKQHVEVTRDIAAKFNQTFGEVFKLPEPRIAERVAVIPGLDGQKMSKSYGNTIGLFDDPKDVKAKIMRIATDSTPLEAPKDPDACRVFALYRRGQALATLPAGTRLRVLAERGDWLHVTVADGPMGWLALTDGLEDGYVKAADVLIAATEAQLDWLE